MTVEYSFINSWTGVERIENVYQIIYEEPFIEFHDGRGDSLGSVNIAKCEYFTVVDYELSCERSDEGEKCKEQSKIARLFKKLLKQE